MGLPFLRGHIYPVRDSHWPKRQMLSDCELPLEEAVGKDLNWVPGAEGGPKPTADRVASSLTAWLHFWCWAENLAKLSCTLSQYFEIINVLFQDIKLKVFYAQVENEYNLFSLSERTVYIIPLRIYLLHLFHVPDTPAGTWDMSQILNVYIVNSCSVFDTGTGNGRLK